MAFNLNDLMLTCGVTNHPVWFSDIGLKYWPMPHQMDMVMKYPRFLRYGDFGEPGVGKTFPAQIHAVLMAALGNKVVFVMPPKPIIQFMREFEDFFIGVRKHLKIEHLDIDLGKKKKSLDEWDRDGWPDILIISYDTFRLFNDKRPTKAVGANLWRIRNEKAVGTDKEFSTHYHTADGQARWPEAQPYTADGRKITIKKGKGKAKNPYQMLLFEKGYHVMFFDEAQALCGMDSILSESVAEISARLKDEVAIYLMSGSPVPTHLHDCYGLIRLINQEAYLNKAAFQRQHCVIEDFRLPLPGGGTRRIPKIVDYVNVEKVYESLWQNASRVQKRDVLPMPEPIITEVPVKLSPDHAKLYRNVVNDRFAILGDRVLTPDNQSQLRHMGLQLISAPESFGYTGKNLLTETTRELVETIKPSAERKIIIFAYYRSVMEKLAQDYQQYNPAVVYGGSNNAQAEIDRFKEDPNSCLLIINWISGGTALNLQCASYIIFYECPTSPKDASQAIARADRTGQLKMVNVYFMRVLKTLSDKNFKMLLKNEESNNRVVKDRHGLLHELLG